ncbi:major capsid protein [Chitinophaga niabensis]|uniref:major capsid protein n=1 Tax=Chitinophaga niabensis TaxID=536979 RepID=UPI0031BA4756
MVKVTDLVSEFNRADMQAYVERYTLGNLQYKTYFPGVYTPNLTFESLQAQFSAIVAADVVAFDSRAPRKGRPLPGKMTGDIPKIEISRPKKETDLNRYRMLLSAISQTSNGNASAQAKRALVDWMYEDTKFCLDGVNARLEWLAKQVASNGKYSLTIANNEAGVQTKVEVDFGIPSANRKNAAFDWSNPTTAKPITDFKTVDTASRAKGIILGYAFMTKETFDQFVAAEETQKAAATFASLALNNLAVPNLETVNTVLRNRSLPQIIIWDSYVNIESKAGVHTAVSGWQEGNVTFSVTNRLGDTANTTTADAFVTNDVSTKAFNDFVLVKSWAEQDPITVITKGIAYATPVLQGVNNIYILKTKLS